MKSAGFTLIEMLVVCIVATIIFAATLASFESFYRQNRSSTAQSETLNDARLALDRAARQLRNLANPTYNATNTITLATDRDFIFQTSDPAKTWVRYCLDTSGGASAGKLWMSESSGSTISTGMQGPCPGTGWSRQQIVSSHVTNMANGLDRNIFTYSCPTSMPASCPASSVDYPKIDMVEAHLYVDFNPTDNVHETDVSTSVYLRNQNEAPSALVTGPTTLGTRKVALNGTGSSDPEGRTLDFYWFMDMTPPSNELADCTKAPPSSIWQGPVLTETFPSSMAIGSQHTFYLVVRDPGCLTSTFGPVAVTVPS